MTYGIIDTETLGGSCGAEVCSTYDCGLTILQDGKILDYINVLILSNMDLTSAYYGQFKQEFYRNLIKDETVILAYNEEEAEEIIRDWLEFYNVTYVCAYNSGFDFDKTFCRNLLDEYQFIDIMLAFRETIFKQKKYKKFAIEHQYLDSRNRPRATAEMAFQFISKDDSFIEAHTALADAEIEARILDRCLRTHKKITRNVHAIPPKH